MPAVSEFRDHDQGDDPLDAAERLLRFDDGIPVPARHEFLEFRFDALQPVTLLIDRADALPAPRQPGGPADAVMAGLMSSAMRGDFDRSILTKTGHRPWPMPDTPWLMTQTWHNLLFAHWRVDVSAVRKAVPAAFELDLFDGEAWVGIVPFYMTNVGVRGAPSPGWLSSFPELNVRTYVRVADRPGVYFFSLDAGRRLAVVTARMLLNLPYFLAAMRVDCRPGSIVYDSARKGPRPALFKGEYAPDGDPFTASKGSLKYFLTERYCLYHHSRRGIPYRLEIHHPAWSLQSARAEMGTNTMTAGPGIDLGNTPALLHFARRQDVVAWAPTPIPRNHRHVRKVTERVSN